MGSAAGCCCATAARCCCCSVLLAVLMFASCLCYIHPIRLLVFQLLFFACSVSRTACLYKSHCVYGGDHDGGVLLYNCAAALLVRLHAAVLCLLAVPACVTATMGHGPPKIAHSTAIYLCSLASCATCYACMLYSLPGLFACVLLQLSGG